MITVSQTKSLILRLAHKWTPHWVSFYRHERDPERLKSWQKVSLDFQRNGIPILLADGMSFAAHEYDPWRASTDFDQVGPEVPNIENEIFSPANEKFFVNSSSRAKPQQNLVAPFWTASYLGGIRRLRQDYEKGVLHLAIILPCLFLVLSNAIRISVGYSRWTMFVFVILCGCIFVYPLTLIVYVGIDCDNLSRPEDAFELYLPETCLFVSQQDMLFVEVYSATVLVIVGVIFAYFKCWKPLVPIGQRFTRIAVARCTDLKDCIKQTCCCQAIAKCFRKLKQLCCSDKTEEDKTTNSPPQSQEMSIIPLRNDEDGDDDD